MTVIRKTIGRLPVNVGDYDSTKAYGKKNRVNLYGCEWESKIENNTYAPATIVDGEVVPDTQHWHLNSGVPSNYNLVEEVGELETDVNNLKEAVGTGGSVDTRIANAVSEEASARSSADTALGNMITTLETAVGTGGSVDSRISSAVNAAKSEIKGSATSACDTLGEAEALISANATAISNESTARANAVSAEAARAQAAEGALQQLYENLTQSDIVVVADHTQVASPSADIIYREQGTNAYSDWMWYNNAWKKMAEYDNATDDTPTAGSDNLVKSGGVYPIQDSVSKLVNITPDSFVHGKFYYYDGERINEGFSYTKYSVLGGRNYKISSGFSNNTDIKFLYWLDSNNNFISSAPPSGGSDPVVLSDVIVTAPSNAVYACLNCYNSYTGIVSLKLIDDMISSNEQETDIEDLYKLIKIKDRLAYTVEPNCFFNNGGFVSNSTMNVWKINIEGAKRYLFKNQLGPDQYGFYHLVWLRDDVIISYQFLATQYDFNVEPQIVEAPALANKVYVNASKTGASTFFCDVKGNFDGIQGIRGTLTLPNLGEITESGIWLLTDTYTYTDKPNNSVAAFLKVANLNSWVLQEYLDFNGNYFKRQFYTSDSPSEWQRVSGSNYNITNEFTNVQQTVNLTATPSITSDTNNYLAPSGDDTDRTADILAMLQSNGICRLGGGIYYVDSLVMPANSSLIGSGSATKIILKSGDNKFAVKMGNYCTVSNLSIYGNPTIIAPTVEGTRHGIVWEGNYTANPNADEQPIMGTISDVYLFYFTGGGIFCSDTGYGTHNFLSVTNVHVFRSYVGIYIKYWSEYSKFTNVRCAYCHYGCINNGGNNVFVNCDFSSSQHIAFLMDNSLNQSPNNSHGSCVACVFNHTTEGGVANSGIGIKVLNCDNGFTFDGCQIFYSQIDIEDSDGVEFVGCVFGQSNCDITIANGGVVLFANNMHGGAPTINITNNNKVHFVNCYNKSTGALISN